MRNIQVAAHDHGLLLVQLQQIGAKVIFPVHAVVQAAQAVLAIGRVAGHQVEVRHLQCDDAALMVVLIDADAISHIQRLVAAVDGRARVALLIGIVPVGAVTVKFQVQLSSLHLGFLQAEEVGIEFLKDVAEALAHHGPQAVYVPRDEFHFSVFWLILQIYC